MIDALLLVALALVASGTMALAVFLGWVALCCGLDVIEARRRRRNERTVRDATGKGPE